MEIMNKHTMDEFNKDFACAVGNGFDPDKPTVTIDVSKYMHMLDDADMDEPQKQEFLETLWTIMVGFVDLGFGVHPTQEACGQNSKLSNQWPNEPPGSLE